MSIAKTLSDKGAPVQLDSASIENISILISAVSVLGIAQLPVCGAAEIVAASQPEEVFCRPELAWWPVRR